MRNQKKSLKKALTISALIISLNATMGITLGVIGKMIDEKKAQKHETSESHHTTDIDLPRRQH